jgi:hypothetical protein
VDATGAITSARLWFHLQADSYHTDSLIGVLEQLAGFYAGQRVVLLWDGLSAHWSSRMRATCSSGVTGSRSNGCLPPHPSSTPSNTSGRT